MYTTNVLTNASCLLIWLFGIVGQCNYENETEIDFVSKFDCI